MGELDRARDRTGQREASPIHDRVLLFCAIQAAALTASATSRSQVASSITSPTVDITSRRIFSLAREQEQLGDESPRGEETINDIDRREGEQPRSN